MHTSLESKLKTPPHELFVKGACHIFAREFLRAFSDVALGLRRAGDGDSVGEVPKGRHVYAHHDGWAFDVGGRHREDDYLSSHGWTFWDTSEQELFEADVQNEKGSLNRWHHYLDEEFVRSASLIARDFIASRTRVWLPL